MEEHQIVRRRMRQILDHVAGNEDVSSPPNHHLLPMNCSSTLNSPIRRCDNRLLFARQGSASQSGFMQQVSVKQSFGLGNSLQQNLLHKCSTFGNGYASYEHSGEPFFSRPVQAVPNLSNLRDDQPAKKQSTTCSVEASKFARPNSGMSEKKPLSCNRAGESSSPSGKEWSPRMDVVELGSQYVVTIELPGVSIVDIRVEVDDQNLIVIGKRSTQRWRVSNGSNTTYHRREILQGPYEVVWQLPKNVNKDNVSAEFIDGFLQVTLPKF